eukprot:1189373-Prorocentrum_minimum.AAC.1
MQRIIASFHDHNPEVMRMEAHSLKGASASCSAHNAYSMCEILESTVKTQDQWPLDNATHLHLQVSPLQGVIKTRSLLKIATGGVIRDVIKKEMCNSQKGGEIGENNVQQGV